MYGITFIMNWRSITQTEIAEKLQVTPQTVNKWTKRIKPIPEKHKEMLGTILNVHPMYLDRELQPEDIVFIMYGTIISGEKEHTTVLEVLQQTVEMQRKQLQEAETNMQSVEKKAEKIVLEAGKLQKHLYLIEDEAMKQSVRTIVSQADKIMNVVNNIDHLLHSPQGEDVTP